MPRHDAYAVCSKCSAWKKLANLAKDPATTWCRSCNQGWPWKVLREVEAWKRQFPSNAAESSDAPAGAGADAKAGNDATKEAPAGNNGKGRWGRAGKKRGKQQQQTEGGASNGSFDPGTLQDDELSSPMVLSFLARLTERMAAKGVISPEKVVSPPTPPPPPPGAPSSPESLRKTFNDKFLALRDVVSKGEALAEKEAAAERHLSEIRANRAQNKEDTAKLRTEVEAAQKDLDWAVQNAGKKEPSDIDTNTVADSEGTEGSDRRNLRRRRERDRTNEEVQEAKLIETHKRVFAVFAERDDGLTSACFGNPETALSQFKGVWEEIRGIYAQQAAEEAASSSVVPARVVETDGDAMVDDSLPPGALRAPGIDGSNSGGGAPAASPADGSALLPPEGFVP